MKISVSEVESWEREAFKGLEVEHQLEFSSEKLTGDSACWARGITVCNVPSYGKNTVAEHVFGLLLTISRRLEEAIDRTRKGDFSPRGLQGFDLRGKTLGVVGTGDIGREVVRIANGFGMNVLGFDVKRDEQAARALSFRYVDLPRLLRESDVITLHVPSNPKTHHLLADEQFAAMKDGVDVAGGRGPRAHAQRRGHPAQPVQHARGGAADSGHHGRQHSCLHDRPPAERGPGNMRSGP